MAEGLRFDLERAVKKALWSGRTQTFHYDGARFDVIPDVAGAVDPSQAIAEYHIDGRIAYLFGPPDLRDFVHARHS